MSFTDDWKKESEAAIKATQETVKVAAIELFSGVITSSPVGNPSLWKNPNSVPEGYVGGSFRSNWYLTQYTPSVKYDKDKNQKESFLISELTKKISTKYSEQWTLTNNAPYAERIENGWSSQAEAGVIAPNVSRVNELIPKIAEVANKKYGVK